LIDGFGISGSYNLVADSFKLSNLIVTLRSSLLSKVNITANAVLDPYQYDELGNRVDRFVWSKSPSLGKINTANISLQSSFRGGEDVVGNQNAQTRMPITALDGMPLNEYEEE